jgi:hypothetical protein
MKKVLLMPRRQSEKGNFKLIQNTFQNRTDKPTGRSSAISKKDIGVKVKT